MTLSMIIDTFLPPAMKMYERTGIKPLVTVKIPSEFFKTVWLEWCSRSPFGFHTPCPLRFQIHAMIAVEQD